MGIAENIDVAGGAMGVRAPQSGEIFFLGQIHREKL